MKMIGIKQNFLLSLVVLLGLSGCEKSADTLDTKTPQLRSKVANIDTNNSEIANIHLGMVQIISHGSDRIESFRLEGIGSSNFQISNNGVLSTKTTTQLDCKLKDKYNLEAIAQNKYGDSDGVDVTIYVNCMDEPVLRPITITVNAYDGNFPKLLGSFEFLRTGKEENNISNIKSISIKEDVFSDNFDTSSIPNISYSSPIGSNDKGRYDYQVRATNENNITGPYVEMTIFVY